MFSVIERATGEWVGRLGPWQPDGWPGPEIAYGVRAKFAGRGYAFEGAVAACDFAVEFLKWDELTHNIDPANTRSQALAIRLAAANRGPARLPAPLEIGRASCRERVCRSVWVSVGGVPLKKQTQIKSV